jgi:hypothetical protein
MEAKLFHADGGRTDRHDDADIRSLQFYGQPAVTLRITGYNPHSVSKCFCYLTTP